MPKKQQIKPVFGNWRGGSGISCQSERSEFDSNPRPLLLFVLHCGSILLKETIYPLFFFCLGLEIDHGLA